MEKIRIDYEKSGLADISELHDFQGNLKELSEDRYKKLRKQILELGFSEPIAVWQNGKKKFILNGHQRLKTLKLMQEDGIEIPKIPINYIKAKNIKEAKRKVLSLTSQYGEMTMTGLNEFMKDSGLKFDDISDFAFPEISFTEFKAAFIDSKNAPMIDPEIEFSKEIDERNDYIVLMFESREEFKKACDKVGVKVAQAQLSTRDNENFKTVGVGRILDGKKIINRL